MKHSRFSPSSAHRWSRCQRFAQVGWLYPTTAGESAERGTRIHEFASKVIIDTLSSGKYPEPWEPSEEAEIVADYVDYITGIVGKGHICDTWRVEHTLPTPWGGVGTADFLYYEPIESVIHVVDLKTGRAEVSAEKNEQLMIYGWLAQRHLWRDADRVTIHIVQPLAGSSYATYSVNRLKKNVEELQLAVFDVENATNEGEILPPTAGDWCRYCPCIGDCPAMREELEVVESAPNAYWLSNNKLARIVALEKPLKEFMASCKKEAIDRIQSGESVGDYSVKTRRGARYWADEAGLELERWLPIEKVYELKILGVGTIEKSLSEAGRGKEEIREMLEGLVERRADSYHLEKGKKRAELLESE